MKRKENSMKINRWPAAGLLFTAAAMIAGCLFDKGDSKKKSGLCPEAPAAKIAAYVRPRLAGLPPYSVYAAKKAVDQTLRSGLPIDSIVGAQTAVLSGHILCVANRDPSALGIVGLDINADTVVSFHGEALPPNDLALVEDSLLVIAETDYVTGALSMLNVADGRLQSAYKTVDGDNALSVSGAKAFLLERTSGAVTGFTGGKLEAANVFLNIQAGGNPQYAALSGNKTFITRYGKASLLVADAAQVNGGILDSIDLSAYVADSLKCSPGAVPNMDGIVAYGNKLFVAVQRLTGYAAKDTSRVVIINADTRTVAGVIDLKFKNPVNVSVLGKYLYVTGIQGYDGTGGVEKIDMETGTNAGVVATAANFPFDIYNFVPVSATKGYVFYGGFDGSTQVIRLKAVAVP